MKKWIVKNKTDPWKALIDDKGELGVSNVVLATVTEEEVWILNDNDRMIQDLDETIVQMRTRESIEACIRIRLELMSVKRKLWQDLTDKYKLPNVLMTLDKPSRKIYLR